MEPRLTAPGEGSSLDSGSGLTSGLLSNFAGRHLVSGRWPGVMEGKPASRRVDRRVPPPAAQWKENPLARLQSPGLAGTISTVGALTRPGGLPPDAPSTVRNRHIRRQWRQGRIYSCL